MRIIGNEQKNNGQNFWDILERIIGKILSIIGAGLSLIYSNITPVSLHIQKYPYSLPYHRFQITENYIFKIA